VKYFKIKVKREPLKGGGVHYVYPEGFSELKFFSILYESHGDPEAVESRPNMEYEFVLIEAPDNVKVEIIDCEEVTKEKRDELKGKWTPKAKGVVGIS